MFFGELTRKENCGGNSRWYIIYMVSIYLLGYKGKERIALGYEWILMGHPTWSGGLRKGKHCPL